MTTMEIENRISRNIDTLLNDVQNSPAQSSCFTNLYKQPTLQNDQESRRSALLQVQKERRESNFDKARPNVQSNDASKKRNEYNWQYVYRLMFSEWFVDIPEMLETEWCFKLCPVGTRSLIVAKNGGTTHYNKNGKFVNKFKSQLPGGNGGKHKYKSNVVTILDCIYNKSSKVYYVLDVLKWGGKDITNCQTDFRFFWLQSKFEEEPEISQITEYNEYPFVPLSADIVTREALAQSLSSVHKFATPTGDTSPKIDGVLFYHIETSYEPGFTPLVGWLKCYMFPEILSISVHESYMEEKPKNYTNLENLIKESQQSKHNWWTNVKKNNRRKKNEDEHMEDLVSVENEEISVGEMESEPVNAEPFINPNLYSNTFNFNNLTGKS